VRRGVRQGVFVTDSPRLTVFALLGMSNWVHMWYDPRGAGRAETVADALVTFAERGYLRTPGRRRWEIDARLDRVERDLRAIRPLLRTR
jgi:hypothetical protein